MFMGLKLKYPSIIYPEKLYFNIAYYWSYGFGKYNHEFKNIEDQQLYYFDYCNFIEFGCEVPILKKRIIDISLIIGISISLRNIMYSYFLEDYNSFLTFKTFQSTPYYEIWFRPYIKNKFIKKLMIPSFSLKYMILKDIKGYSANPDGNFYIEKKKLLFFTVSITEY